MASAEPHLSTHSSTEEFRLLLCGLLVLLGSIVIVGWLLGIEALKAIVPGFSTMKFNAALAFVFTGIGLAFARPARIALAMPAGLIVAAIGTLTLTQYATGLSFGIDQLFVADHGPLSGSGHPGRMSLLTATAFTALGLSIVLLARARNRSQVVTAHALALIPGVVVVLAAAGYTFGAEAFWWLGRYTAIAVHTLGGLLVAVAATLMTRAEAGWLQPYVDSPAARALLARLLPLAGLIPLTIGAVLMLGAGLGAYNAPYGFALFIPLMTIALVLVALWVAAQQRESELIRLRYERHLQLVVAELNHRVKNTLAIVQSFAHQSLAGNASIADAGVAFEGRLTALASAHKLLTRENWDQVRLVQLVANSIKPHVDQGARFLVDGPDMAVTPKTSVTLAMTLHELATNSIKYGALSSSAGRILIQWRVAEGQFRFTWHEQDGPPCPPPTSRGFGTRMLNRALAAELGGKAKLEFAPTGLRYEVTAPAREPL
jgi:two-component sensor histidine kinase